jgi:adenylate cyclase
MVSCFQKVVSEKPPMDQCIRSGAFAFLGGDPVTEERAQRRLTAILSADVKGYSRLMGEDELSTVETLKSHREVVSSFIRQYGGRVVDSPGDNILAAFGSVVDAVECAVKIQEDLNVKNASVPENRRMEFRIGVNLGEVIDNEGRIYGDGVNVAARIEGLADGGGVCISGTAFDQIGRRLPLGYEYLGERELKNIEKPVRVYRVLTEPEAVGRVIGAERGKPKRGPFGPAVAAIILLLAGLAAWNFHFRPDVEPASVEKMAYPLPEKPSIAVLPFTNLSEGHQNEYFADGLTEEIITALSKVPNLFVIARNSTFTYKNKPVRVQQVAEDLGVQYVLEGSVRKSEDRVRITAQLIDALTGRHLWADRYDRDLKDIFALQDEMTLTILQTLQVKLTADDQYIAFKKGTDNLQAYLKILEGREYASRSNKEGYAMAGKLAEEAITLDPNYPGAYLMLSVVHLMEIMFGTSKSPKQSLSTAEKLVQKALAIDDHLAEGYAFLGRIYLTKRQYEDAFIAGQRACDLAPNSSFAYAALGFTLSNAGRPDTAITYFKKAIRLNPFPPAWYLTSLGRAYLMLGRHKEAIAEFKRGLQLAPESVFPRLGLVAAYSELGREEHARAEAAEVLKLDPKFTLESHAKGLLYKNKDDIDRYLAALRKAGLPEHPPLPLPEKPCIAVLPFENMSDDPEQEYFSEGISEEIINALVRWPTIMVIPRSSSFIYKGKTVGVRQVGREMGVQYILEGSVRREGNRVRVSVQLIDVTTLMHLFSERYEREMKDIFAIQDEITMKVLTAMRVSLSGEGVPSLRGKGTKNIDAYLKVLQAEAIFQAVNRDTQARARRLAEEAIALDPQYARAYTLLAATIGNEVLMGVYKNRREALERAMALAEKAIQLDEFEEWGHRSLGFITILLNKDYEKAIAEAKRAVELAPNSVMAQIVLGYFLYSAGRTEEAIPILQKAVSYSPIPLPRALSHLCIACRKARRYEEAVAVCKQLIQREPNYIYPHLTLAATFAETDKMEEARVEIREVLRINPKYTLKIVPRSFPWKDQAEIDRLIDSLRKAGLPN